MISSLSFGCAVCFGDPTSISSKAVWIAVFFLFGIVAAVLGVIVRTGVVWSKRERKLAEETLQ